MQLCEEVCICGGSNLSRGIQSVLCVPWPSNSDMNGRDWGWPLNLGNLISSIWEVLLTFNYTKAGT